MRNCCDVIMQVYSLLLILSLLREEPRLFPGFWLLCCTMRALETGAVAWSRPLLLFYRYR